MTSGPGPRVAYSAVCFVEIIDISIHIYYISINIGMSATCMWQLFDAFDFFAPSSSFFSFSLFFFPVGKLPLRGNLKIFARGSVEDRRGKQAMINDRKVIKL